MKTTITKKNISNFLLFLFFATYIIDPIILYLGFPRSPSIIVFTIMAVFSILNGYVRCSKLLLFILIIFSINLLLHVRLTYPDSFSLAVQLMYYCAILVIVYCLAKESEPVVFLRWVLFVAVTVLGLSFVAQAEGGASRIGMHPGGNPTHFAAYIASLIVISAFLLTKPLSRKLDKILIIGSVFALLVMLIATQGFNALFSLIMAFTVTWMIFNLLINDYSFKFSSKNAVLFALILFIIIFVLYNFEILIHLLNEMGFRTRKFDTLLSGGGLDSTSLTSGRNEIFFIYLESIWWNGAGNGLGSSIYLVEGGSAAHNQYVTAIFELGLSGFMILSGLFTYFIVVSIKLRSFYGLCSSLLVVFMMLGNDVLYYKYGWLIVFLIPIFIFSKSRININ